MSTVTGVSRRTLIKGAALGATTIGVSAISSALADEKAENYTYADTINWDAEYDVVVLGLGFSGMASAMTAADLGVSVLIAEKAPDGHAGGNSRVCGQVFAYANGDVDSAKKYYRALASGREISDEMIERIATGVANSVNIVSDGFGFDKNEFHSLKESHPTYCPEYPEFPGSDVIEMVAIHDGNSDSFFYQSMRDRLITEYIDKIDVWFESPAKDLIQDPISKTVIGVRIERNGGIRNIRALNGLCVCTGGFECDPKMLQDFLAEINFAIGGGTYNEGDGIKMCQKIGARLWHMDTWEGSNFSYDVGVGGTTIAVPNLTYNGAGIMVGNCGKRYLNETEVSRHQHYSDGNGLWNNPLYPENIYCVFDATQMKAIEETGGINSNYIDTLCKCTTIAEAADVIGCEANNLQKTIDDFNMFVELGEDYEFGRDVSTMRAYDGEAYYVLPVRHSVLNTQGGPERNIEAQILNIDGNPIPNLYSAGEMGGFTACMYQGGTNVAECFIMGQIAGANAATPKDPLPAYTLAPKVESNPAHLGDETDLVIE